MKDITEITTGIRSQLVMEAYEGWLRNNEKILDVGCGDGIISALLKEKFSLKLVGCDIENYLKRKISFRTMTTISSLPFADKSFDVAVFNDSLHHTTLENQKKLLVEALRVADKVLVFEDEPTIIGSVVDWGVNKLHNFHMPITLTFRKHTQWMKLFETLGIRYEFKKVRSPLFYPFIHQAFLLSKKSR